MKLILKTYYSDKSYYVYKIAYTPLIYSKTS